MATTTIITSNNHHASSEGELQLTHLINTNLAEAIDLKLQAKQAHWNVKGPAFIALHGLFDQVATEIDNYADMLAERAVQLGGIARGTMHDIIYSSSLPAYQVASQQGEHHVIALSTALRTYAETTQRLIDIAGEQGDAVTADLFTEITRGVDKLRWFVEAHSINL